MKATLTILFALITSFIFSQNDSLVYNKEELTIYQSKALYKKKEIYNSQEEITQFIKKEGIDECPATADVYRNPLSLIDSYFSYEYFFGSRSACGHYGNIIKVETIDLETTKKISLSDLFTEESIVKALKNDSWVLKTIRSLSLEKELDAVNSFTEILDLLNNASYGFRFYQSGFTIVDKKITDEKIGVRFVGSQSLSVSYHRKHLQLGLLLVPKPDFKEKLLYKSKFVLGDYKNGVSN